MIAHSAQKINQFIYLFSSQHNNWILFNTPWARTNRLNAAFTLQKLTQTRDKQKPKNANFKLQIEIIEDTKKMLMCLSSEQVRFTNQLAVIVSKQVCGRVHVIRLSDWMILECVYQLDKMKHSVHLNRLWMCWVYGFRLQLYANRDLCEWERIWWFESYCCIF